jgi:hypothetical protein
MCARVDVIALFRDVPARRLTRSTGDVVPAFAASAHGVVALYAP